MNERKFLQELENRMSEQEKIMKDMIFPNFFLRVSATLGIHPWRVLVPTAFLLSLLLQLTMHKPYDDVILKIFGGFGILKFK